MDTVTIQNELFHAGAGSLLVGFFVSALFVSLRRNQDMLLRKLTASVEFTSKDKSYEWLMFWMQKNGITARLKHVMVAPERSRDPPKSYFLGTKLIAGRGRHYFVYGNRPIWMTHTRERFSANPALGSFVDVIRLTTIGFNPKILDSIQKEATELASEELCSKTGFYKRAGFNWIPCNPPRQRRALSSVVIDDVTTGLILNDVRKFMESERWYMERGIPYQRGYLLYGPPGCGKSSFVVALAGEVGLDVCVLNLGSDGLSDKALLELFSCLPPYSLLLIEDIDVIKGDTPYTSYFRSMLPNTVTMSGLLNALDGALPQNGRMVFMTTNHLDRLSPTLRRPGRVDLAVQFGHASYTQVQRLFLRFYPGFPYSCSERFAEKVVDLGLQLTISQLQQYFIQHRNDAQAAISSVHKLQQPK